MEQWSGSSQNPTTDLGLNRMGDTPVRQTYPALRSRPHVVRKLLAARNKRRIVVAARIGPVTASGSEPSTFGVDARVLVSVVSTLSMKVP